MSSLQRIPSHGFEIGFPEGWRDATQMVLLGPERPVFTPNVQVMREPLPDVPVDEFVSYQRSELATLDGFRLIGHGDRMLGGQRALHHAYAWNLPEHPGHRIRQQQITCQRGAEIFTITCSALEGDWDVVEAGFELILSGFAWT